MTVNKGRAASLPPFKTFTTRVFARRSSCGGCFWLSHAQKFLERVLQDLGEVHARFLLFHTGLSFMQVMQTQKRERELMKRMEFVPHTLENNNGLPAYGTTNESSEDEE